MSADDRTMMPLPTTGRAPAKRRPKRVVAEAVALLFATLVSGASLDAIADQPSGLLRGRYPAGSIASTERADAALEAAAGMRGRIERDFRDQAKACAGRFLVNACLDEARDGQRKRLADVEAVQLEADRYKRRDHGDRLEAERVRREAERTAAQPADAAVRARNRAAYDERQAAAAREVGERAKSERARSAAAARVPKPGSGTLRGPAVPSGPSAGERARNASEHAAKVAEADVHRQEIARRVAAKTADRKRRADEKAAKDARAAARVGPTVPVTASPPVPKP